jgi:hypothetical protein
MSALNNVVAESPLTTTAKIRLRLLAEEEELG